MNKANTMMGIQTGYSPTIFSVATVMGKKEPQGKSLQVDQSMLRAFARGQLDEATENKIVALLEKRPELQSKVAAVSVPPILQKMNAFSMATLTRTVGEKIDDLAKTRVIDETASDIDIPSELEALSEFRIIKELGRGGMGIVYLAENRWMGNRKEVLKVLNERLISNPDAKIRFQQEIEVTAALDHPSIVKPYSVRPLKNILVFSMEFVPGVDLHHFLATNGCLPLHLTSSIAIDVCAGLQHAMNKNAVHRDIKPSNIILYRAKNKINAKILDFGLGRLERGEFQKGLTQTNTLLGTLEFVAPEQSVDAAKVDIRADIYSLGCSIYNMIAGRPPFTGSYLELIGAHTRKVPKALNELMPHVPGELSDIVAKMLAKNPAERFQTPKEVALALKPFVSHYAKPQVILAADQSQRTADTQPATSAIRDTSVESKRGLEAPDEPQLSSTDVESNQESTSGHESASGSEASRTQKPVTRRQKMLNSAAAVTLVLVIGATAYMLFENPFRKNSGSAETRNGLDESGAEKDKENAGISHLPIGERQGNSEQATGSAKSSITESTNSKPQPSSTEAIDQSSIPHGALTGVESSGADDSKEFSNAVESLADVSDGENVESWSGVVEEELAKTNSHPEQSNKIPTVESDQNGSLVLNASEKEEVIEDYRSEDSDFSLDSNDNRMGDVEKMDSVSKDNTSSNENDKLSQWQVLFDKSESSHRDNWIRDSGNRGKTYVYRGTLTVAGGTQVGANASTNTMDQYKNFHFFAVIQNPDRIAKSIRIREGSDGLGYSISIGGYVGNSLIMPGSYAYQRREERKKFQAANRSWLDSDEKYRLEIIAFDEQIFVKVNGEEVVKFTDSQRIESSPISLLCPADSKVRFHDIGIRKLNSDFDFDRAMVGKPSKFGLPWSQNVVEDPSGNRDSAISDKFVAGSVWLGSASRHVTGSPSKTDVPIKLTINQIGNNLWNGELSVEQNQIMVIGHVKNGLSWQSPVMRAEKGYEVDSYTGSFSGEQLSISYDGRIFDVESDAHHFVSSRSKYRKPKARRTSRGKATLSLNSTRKRNDNQREQIIGEEVERLLIDFENQVEMWKQDLVSELKGQGEYTEWSKDLEQLFDDPTSQFRRNTRPFNSYSSKFERAKRPIAKALYEKFIEKSNQLNDWSQASDVLEVCNELFPNRFLVGGQIWGGRYAVNRKETEQTDENSKRVFELSIEKMDGATFTGSVRFDKNDPIKIKGWFIESSVIFENNEKEYRLRHQGGKLKGTWDDKKVEFELEK